MSSAKRQAIILTLLKELRERESWCGETHVQKSTHFLQDGLGVSLDVEFIMYKHGPFSFELREVLGEMRASQLLELEPNPPYGPRLKASASGQSLVDRFPKTVKRYSPQIEFVAEKLGSRNVLDLEKIGTALYVTRGSPSLSADDRAEQIHELKPQVQKSAAITAIREVDGLLALASSAGLLINDKN